MTITRTIGAFHDSSNARIRKIGLLTGPASYATGGDPLTAAALGMGKIELLLMEPFANATAIVFARYDATLALVKFFDMAGTELAAATDLSGYSARFEAIGT